MRELTEAMQRSAVWSTGERRDHGFGPAAETWTNKSIGLRRDGRQVAHRGTAGGESFDGRFGCRAIDQVQRLRDPARTMKSGACVQDDGSEAATRDRAHRPRRPRQKGRVQPRKRRSPAAADDAGRDNLRIAQARHYTPRGTPGRSVAIVHLMQEGRARQDVVVRIEGIAAEGVARAQLGPGLGHDLHQAHRALG